MPTITIDGKACEFTPGQVILQVAIEHGLAIPYYCYHPGLSIVASCRICLVEAWQPNPRAENRLEPLPKLIPSCQTAAVEGMVVYSDSPKALQNQKAVMEYLLINHPLDCPVCDQAGECLLQDYSYQYGRSTSRFEEDKIKQPKKDLGPNVLLYADRCIMCSRCVRFTREITGTAELTIEGRGAHEQIDVFPGKALDNELASNVVDLCPVGALLDKDFLFAQRVWHLKAAPSIDGVTASGDNIWLEHNEGRVHRIKPRENMAVNRWWITDETRYNFGFIHSDDRIPMPVRRQFGKPVETDHQRAVLEAVAGLRGKRIGLLVSPMLSCEDAFLLASACRELGAEVTLGVNIIPRRGEDHVYPPGSIPAPEGPGYVVRAEKCPNARGVRRVLEAVNAGSTGVLDAAAFTQRLKDGAFDAAVLTGNYPADWSSPDLVSALDAARSGGRKTFVVLIDTLRSSLMDRADVVLPGATWAEKGGTFENATGRLQSFEQAITPVMGARAEGQLALDLAGAAKGERPALFDAQRVRHVMAHASQALSIFESGVHHPEHAAGRVSDMAMVEL